MRKKKRQKLTPRLQMICELISRGYPDKLIADKLKISAWTVRTHIKRIFSLFHVQNRAAIPLKWERFQRQLAGKPKPVAPKLASHIRRILNLSPDEIELSKILNEGWASDDELEL